MKEEYVQILLDKSQENFKAAEILKAKGWLNAAMSRLYYSLFLLIKYKLKGYNPGPGADSHKKTFYKIFLDYNLDFFNKLNKFKQKRVIADYYTKSIQEKDFEYWLLNYIEIQKALEKIHD